MLCSSFSAIVEGVSGVSGGIEMVMRRLGEGSGNVGAVVVIVVFGGGSLGGGEVRRDGFGAGWCLAGNDLGGLHDIPPSKHRCRI
jgi:hypothetical protein